MLASHVGKRRIERLAGGQRLRNRERIACVHGIIAEETIGAAVHVIAAGLGDDVDGGAAGAPQFRVVIAAVDLELLDRVLAHGEAHAARIVIHFAAIHGHAVAAAVAAIEREPALGRLFHAEILIARQAGRVADGRRQQRERKIVTPVDGQLGDVFAVDDIRLCAPLRVHYRRLSSHFHRFGHGRDFHFEIKEHSLAHVHHHALAQALGLGLPDADDVEAALVGDLRHDGADLVRAHVEADDVAVFLLRQ